MSGSGDRGGFGRDLPAPARAPGRPAMRRRLDGRLEQDPILAAMVDSPPLRSLVEATASLAGILAFYEDRMAAEGHLISATRPRAVHELLAPLGLRPRPALAATTWLAVLVDERRGGPPIVQVPPGLAARSTPRGKELPQVFELDAGIEARVSLNAIPLQAPPAPAPGLTSAARVLRLQRGVGVQVGDRLLVTADDFAAVAVVAEVVRQGPRATVTLTGALSEGEGRVLTRARAATLGPPTALLGADAEPFASLPLTTRLEHSGPVGGARALEDGGWRVLEDLLPDGVVDLMVTRAGAWVAALDGALGVSVDRGRTFRRERRGVQRDSVLCLAEDPTGAWLAGTRRGKVLRSTDRGQTWTAVRGPATLGNEARLPRRLHPRLPQEPVRAVLAFGAGDDVHLIAGTDVGVFAFAAGGASWSPVNDGLPGFDETTQQAGAAVRQLLLTPTGAVLAGTDRGLFRTERLGEPWVAVAGPEGGVSDLVIGPTGRVSAVGGDGSLWQGGEGGLTRASLPAGVVARGIAVHPAGGRWLLAEGGLHRETTAGFVLVPEPVPEPLARLVATDRGLALLQAVSDTVDTTWPGFDVPADAVPVSRTLRRRPSTAVLLDGPGAVLGVRAVVHASRFDARAFGRKRRGTVLHLDAGVDGLDRRTSQVCWPARSVGEVQAVVALTPGAARLDQVATLARASTLGLGLPVEDLAGRMLLIAGKAPRVGTADPVDLQAASTPRTLQPDETARVTGLPDAQGRWPVRTDDGVHGLLPAAGLRIAPPDKHDPTDAVLRQARGLAAGSPPRLTLDRPIDRPLHPDHVVVHANVVPASHGRSTEEVLGSGDASVPSQQFRLRQQPLVFRPAQDGSVTPDLEVFVDGVRWDRAPLLERCGPDAQAYAVETTYDGGVVVRFGDGTCGRRLPTGSENVLARFRVGGGAVGNLAAGDLRKLRQPPRGLRGIAHVVPATGGEDAEPADAVRTRLAAHLRSLDTRVVSPRDIDELVRDWPGVAEVDTRTVFDGRRDVLALVVMTDDAAAAHRLDDPRREAILRALQARGVSSHQVQVLSCVPVDVALHATLDLDPRRSAPDVLTQARTRLAAAVRGRRSLGVDLSALEVLAPLLATPGVRDVALSVFTRDASSGASEPVLRARPTRAARAGSGIEPAELLVLDPAAAVLQPRSS